MISVAVSELEAFFLQHLNQLPRLPSAYTRELSHSCSVMLQ
jgi:hypothetical protein